MECEQTFEDIQKQLVFEAKPMKQLKSTGKEKPQRIGSIWKTFFIVQDR